MTERTSKPLLTILVDDQGAWMRDQEGRLIGRLPDASPGSERQAAWAGALKQAAPAGTVVQVMMGHGTLTTQCQEVPFLGARDVREVAARMVVAAMASGEACQTAGVIDKDPRAEGGHVLWAAALPALEMADWVQAIERAGLVFDYAIPTQRAMLRGMEDVPDLPDDRLLLTLERGYQGHLFVFHGRSLALARAFSVPEDDESADEVVYEEVSRLIQFYKQRNRNITFTNLYLVGLQHLTSPLENRIQATLRLSTAVLSRDLWPLLLKGLGLERQRKDGLNLVPIEVQEAGRRRWIRRVVWTASLALVGLLCTGTVLLGWQARAMKREADLAEAALALREARSSEEARIVGERLPLLQVRLAERHQEASARALARLAKRLLDPPEGIRLEQVEILQVQGTTPSYRFKVSGLSFTGVRFSVGPLAAFAQSIRQEEGVVMDPIQEVRVNDRLATEGATPDARAVTRFTLEGKLP